MFAESLVPLFSLILLEIILGIDNIIFISILADRLPPEKRRKLRILGISLALVIRLVLLAFVSWILKLDSTLFTLFGIAFSGKGLILITGGVFLLFKASKEILYKTETTQDVNAPEIKRGGFNRLLLEVILLDLVFSIDSIITAVGMVQELWIMYTAVICAVTIMLIAARPISAFIGRHPSFKILALCFLMMIGVALLAEGLHFKIPKGYIYYSMAFAFIVDLIQMKKLSKERKRSAP